MRQIQVEELPQWAERIKGRPVTTSLKHVEIRGVVEHLAIASDGHVTIAVTLESGSRYEISFAAGAANVFHEEDLIIVSSPGLYKAVIELPLE